MYLRWTNCAFYDGMCKKGVQPLLVIAIVMLKYASFRNRLSFLFLVKPDHLFICSRFWMFLTYAQAYFLRFLEWISTSFVRRTSLMYIHIHILYIYMVYIYIPRWECWLQSIKQSGALQLTQIRNISAASLDVISFDFMTRIWAY